MSKNKLLFPDNFGFTDNISPENALSTVTELSIGLH